MVFNRSAYTINTTLKWLMTGVMLFLGVVLLAPPESLARQLLITLQGYPVYSVMVVLFTVTLFALLSWVRACTLQFSMTDGYIEFRVGTVVQKYQWILRRDIRNIRLKANIIEQKLNAATLEIETVGTGGVDIQLPQLRRHEAEAIRKQLLPEETTAANDPEPNPDPAKSPLSQADAQDVRTMQ